MLEKYLIDHCSPTLASIKTANLFTYFFQTEKELMENMDYWNRQMQEKGVMLFLLRKRERTALIYVCRPSMLDADMKRQGVAEFLKGCGYESTEMEYVLRRLAVRLRGDRDFPHEIGLFLGYPLGDVVGFIENGGRNYKCAGCWKVYCNECEAVRMFARYKKCRDIYTRLWRQGRSVRLLTVAA